MTSADFSGREIVKVLTQNHFYVIDQTGSHVKLRYEHPHNEDDVRIVIVPMHDSIKSGTLRSIADQAGAKDFQKFKDWIDRSI